MRHFCLLCCDKNGACLKLIPDQTVFRQKGGSVICGLSYLSVGDDAHIVPIAWMRYAV